MPIATLPHVKASNRQIEMGSFGKDAFPDLSLKAPVVHVRIDLSPPCIQPPRTTTNSEIYSQARTQLEKDHRITSISDWPMPSRDREYIKHCEWVLWKAAECCRLDGNKDKWLLGFYLKLATSSREIREVFQGKCKSPKYADALMSVLFRESDSIESEVIDERDKRPVRYVHSSLMRKHEDRQRRLMEKEEQRRANHDLKTLAKIKQLVDQLEGRYKVQAFAEHALYIEQASGQELTFSKLIALYEEFVRRKISLKAKGKAGRLAMDNGSVNTYCWLIRRFVKRAYSGRDHLEKAMDIINHFAPTLQLGDDANRFGSRLDAFEESKIDGEPVLKDLKRYEHLFLTQQTFLAHSKIFLGDFPSQS